jgi:tripartite-type tricarboxylate transporter receptor subunit TctC
MLRRIVLAGALCALPLVATAQGGFPTKPIKIISGFTAGSTGDLIARVLAKPLSEQMGQPVLVENRPGGGGQIAAAALLRADPDGHTLMIVPSGHASNAAMKRTQPFHPVNDFAFVTLITRYPLALVVKQDSPLRSFADLMQQVKAQPGKLNYSAGTGTAMHLFGEWLMAESGGSTVRVPFSGDAAAITELLAGRVDVSVIPFVAISPVLKDGRARALAVTSGTEYSQLPGVPTVAATYNGLELESWQGIVAPVATPPAVTARLAAEFRRAMENPDVRRQFLAWGIEATPEGPTEFRNRVARDIEKMERVANARNLKTD